LRVQVFVVERRWRRDSGVGGGGLDGGDEAVGSAGVGVGVGIGAEKSQEVRRLRIVGPGARGCAWS